MPRDGNIEYEVGYGKPPRHTRFVKGQSGNPRGRPSGAKNLTTLLDEALNEPVTVTDKGGRRKLSKREAIFTQLVNRAVTGDFRAMKILLDLLRDFESQNQPASSETTEFGEADKMVLEQLNARLAKG